MSNKSIGVEVIALKDGGEERPIPTAWRQIFRDIVGAFAKGDYALAGGVSGAESLSERKAAEIRDNIEDYGATLVALPDDTWDTSVCIWYGDHWDALVDLWTREEGRSDLVLHCRVIESGQGIVVAVHLVYVP